MSNFSMRALFLVRSNFVSQFSHLIFNFHVEIAYDTIQSLNCVVDKVFSKKILRLLINYNIFLVLSIMKFSIFTSLF